MGDEGARDFWRVIAAFFLPPLGVFLQVGLGIPFWINLLMFLSGFLTLPAQLHAVWVIANTREDGRAAADGTSTFFALLLAFWLPPVGVLLKRGIGAPVIINVLLTILMWVPGILHAAWVITNDE